MPTFQSFTEIEAWQKARALTFEVYSVSKKGGFSKDFGLATRFETRVFRRCPI
jgi:hypothetical protein